MLLIPIESDKYLPHAVKNQWRSKASLANHCDSQLPIENLYYTFVSRTRRAAGTWIAIFLPFQAAWFLTRQTWIAAITFQNFSSKRLQSSEKTERFRNTFPQFLSPFLPIISLRYSLKLKAKHLQHCFQKTALCGLLSPQGETFTK